MTLADQWDAKLKDDFYAEWKREKGLLDEDAWKRNLAVGQTVVAAQPIEYYKGSSDVPRTVRVGRFGTVIEPGKHKGEWVVYFDREKEELVVVYEPNAEYDEFIREWWDTEVVTLDEWEAERRTKTPKPINNPEMYDQPLL